MHVVIVHYHLNRGGVTRVIENQLRGLAALDEADRPNRVTIFYGGRHHGWSDTIAVDSPFSVSKIPIPLLDYDNRDVLEVPTSALFADLKSALVDADCDRDSTVLHVHNHSLGKNSSLPRALLQLAREGWRMLLQVHDFAEELRPQNYENMLRRVETVEQLQQQLYPQADHIHYAVLSHRDWNMMERAGWDMSRVHLLPNAVSSAAADDGDRVAARQKLAARFAVPEDRPYVLYPVRAIRRKNIGEILLWSAVLPDWTFGITLAPLNEQERPAYDAWVSLSRELELGVLFGVGGDGGLSLEENYAAADATISTSVAEGFGLVFLESYLARKPLLGRDLPGVTADFVKNGMAFPGLVLSIEIPACCYDRHHLLEVHTTLLGDLRAAYRQPELPSDEARTRIETSLTAETIDFARLEAASQCRVIRLAATDTEVRQKLQAINRCFQDVSAQLATAAKQVEANSAVVTDHYSRAMIAQRYSNICRSVLQSSPSPVRVDAMRGKKLLEHFLTPSRLVPIRIQG